MGVTEKSIGEWIERMERLLLYNDGQLANGRIKVERRCCYGAKHFCNGRINKTIRNCAKENRKPCKHFENGQCELMLHIISVKDEV